MLANVSLRTFLPFVVSIAALATQACAAPAGEEASSDAPPADTAIAAGEEGHDALGLAGSAGEIAPSGVGATVAAMSGARAGSSNPDVVAQLVVPSRKAVYDVFAYELGIDDVGTAPGGTADLTAAKPALRPLTVVAQPKAGAPSLANDVLFGGSLGEMTLLARDAFGKFVELAKISGASVQAVKTTASGNAAVEEYTLAMTALTVRSGTSSVTVNIATGSATCADPCPCGTQRDAKLGPFVQATDPTWPVAKGSARVDQIDVAVSQTSKPQLDGVSFSGAFETGGMCAVFAAGLRAFAPAVHLGVASAPSATGAAREATSWDACFTTVKSVSIGSSWKGAYETVELRAGGLLRTDRTFDAYGKETAKSSGWSFLANAPIASCGDVWPK